MKMLEYEGKIRNQGLSNAMGSLSAKVGLSNWQAIMQDIREPLWPQ